MSYSHKNEGHMIPEFSPLYDKYQVYLERNSFANNYVQNSLENIWALRSSVSH